MRNLSGFTILEVLIASVVLVTAIVGTLVLFTNSISITELSRYSTLAQYEVEQKIEEITNNTWDDIKASWKSQAGLNETPFDVSGFPVGEAKGVVYAEDIPGATDQLMRIKVVVCYKQKARLIGEDANLDGLLTGGEDNNLNGELDSPSQLETVIVNKEM